MPSISPRPVSQALDEPEISLPVDADSVISDYDTGPSSLTLPPDYANPAEDDYQWTPPDAASLVAVDFARKIAEDDVESEAFSALLQARLENTSPTRLCQSAALVALGADDGGALRTAMIGTMRDPERPAPVLGPVLLAAKAGALGETQLLAADLLNRHHLDPESCAVAALALDLAGLRTAALRLVLEQVIEEGL